MIMWAGSGADGSMTWRRFLPAVLMWNVMRLVMKLSTSKSEELKGREVVLWMNCAASMFLMSVLKRSMSWGALIHSSLNSSQNLAALFFCS